MKTAKEKDSQRQIEKTLLNNLDIPHSVNDIIKDATFSFKGDARTLESAIGALLLGQIYGWRVLRMMHGSSTYLKYETLLNIKFKEVCPDRGPLSERSLGLRVADKLGGFWKVVTGKVPGRTPTIE